MKENSKLVPKDLPNFQSGHSLHQQFQDCLTKASQGHQGTIELSKSAKSVFYFVQLKLIVFMYNYIRNALNCQKRFYYLINQFPVIQININIMNTIEKNLSRKLDLSIVALNLEYLMGNLVVQGVKKHSFNNKKVKLWEELDSTIIICNSNDDFLK